MNQFSFRSWLTEYGDLFWEGLRDISALPMDKVNLEPIAGGDDDEDGFEEEDFDSDSAWESCSDAGDYIDIADYEDGPIYDDPSEDENFDQQSVDDWEEENPEPDQEDFKSEEEYTAAQEAWQKERDEVEEEYDDAVELWEKENSKRKEAAYEAAQEARDEAVSDCVEERRREHEEEQEERRTRHEDERARNPSVGADNAGYTGRFTVGSDRFEVGLDRESVEFQGSTLKNIFSVTFSGPSGYSLTRNNTGGGAKERYSHLLATVAKMIQEENAKGRPVNGFTFYPAEPAMGLMYQKFYTDYLQPGGYLRVAPKLYLRKDYIREVLKDAPEYKKKSAYSAMTQTNRSVRDDLERVRSEKNTVRSALLMMQKLVGNVVLFKKPYSNYGELLAGLVTKSEPSPYRGEPEASVVAIDGGRLYPFTVTYHNMFNLQPDPADPKGRNVKLAPMGTPTPDKVIPLLQAVVQDPHLLTSIDGVHFRKLLAQYGIQPQLAQQPQQPAEAEPDMSWLTNPQPQPA